MDFLVRDLEPRALRQIPNDGLHLNAAGQALVARELAGVLDVALDDARSHAGR